VRSLSTVAGSWSAATEREVRGYEERLSEQLERVQDLHRQRDRPKTTLIDLDDQPRLEVGNYLDFATVVCATCGRDYRARIGPELTVAGEPEQVVCWPCGFEIAPDLAAGVLAQRAEYAEQDALSFLSTAAKWLSDHVGRLGAGDRSEYFEERCELLRNELRRLKSEAYSDRATWL
jgi:hypothetical protein